MDDRRFDTLVKSLASGTNRRTLLKGLLGLGGVAAAGGALLESDAQAARRPTPTPKPPTCPGQQVPCSSGCCCPAGREKCGPDCCNEDNVPAPETGHSECCDNACCFGTCYGEELCCATNNRSGGEFPIPPTNKICTSTNNGTECCAFDQDCCSFDGCCDTLCWGDGAFCCPNDPVSFCRGGVEVPDVCCVNSGDQLFACCNGGTDARVCYDTSAEGACCTDADCNDPCQLCNPDTNICASICEIGATCCTQQAGPPVCVAGDCCLEDPETCPVETTCCQFPDGNFCIDSTSCIPEGCEPCVEADLDCCLINDEFAGCYDAGAANACCTADTCDGFNNFDECLVGACIDFACEQRSSCLDGQNCCTEQAGPGVCVTGVCCPGGPGCDAGQNCCVEDDGAGPFSYCTSAPCECDRLCSDNGLDCCTTNKVFVGCFDPSVEGTCCFESECAYLSEPDDCLVGACTDLACEQVSTCVTGEVCCSGSCIAGDTCSGGESGDPCANHSDCLSAICCEESCCAEGEQCLGSGLCGTSSDGGEEGDPCLDHSQCLSAICCEGSCCREGDRCLSGVCGIENDGGQPGDICVDHSHCLSAMCCDGRCCSDGSRCCDGECSELECEPSTQCSSDFDCGGDIVCCVGDCCTAGQSCVTDPNNNSYCE